MVAAKAEAVAASLNASGGSVVAPLPLPAPLAQPAAGGGAVVAKRTSLEMVMEVAGYSGNAVEAARQVG